MTHAPSSARTLDSEDGRSLRTGFLASAAAYPDEPAVVTGSASFTYAQLERHARLIAAAFTRGGTTRVERVGVFASRNEVAYSGTLAALFGGAAFVPLNRTFPAERTHTMMRRSRLDALIVDHDTARQLPEVLAGLEPLPLVVAPDDETCAALARKSVPTIGGRALESLQPLDVLPAVLSDDLAYLLFTSGTTGEPKGVGVTHGNVLHYLDAMSARLRISRGDRCSQTFDQTFDLSVHDLFLTWRAAATLYAMQPIELLTPVRFVQKHNLTVWFSVPSAAAMAIRRGTLTPGSMPSLRTSLFCGEPLPDATATAWHSAAPNSIIENLYGPTELTIACFAYRWDAVTSGSRAVNGIVPIGRPLPGLGALVIDEQSHSVTDGEAGELLVCGPQTCPGYWEDAARTRERFVDFAVTETRRKRFYRTGDRVARRDGGEYVYIGRNDDQIKVMGFRVELGEIEAALLAQAGVVQAAAVGWPLEDGRALGTVAFICGPVDSTERVVRALRARLPDYMVPHRIVIIDEMPLNANGKIDRRALTASLGSQPGHERS